MARELIELTATITNVKNTNLSIHIKDDCIILKTHGITWNMALIPKNFEVEDSIVYNPYTDSIGIYYDKSGAYYPLLTIGDRIREVDLTVWDIKNCIGCRAYSIDTGIDMLMQYYGLKRGFATMLLKGIA